MFERVCKERESDVAAANIILFYKWEICLKMSGRRRF